jgi:hypothetical protein
MRTVPFASTILAKLLVVFNQASPLRGLLGSDVTLGKVNLVAVSNLRKRESKSANILRKSGG